MKLEKILAGLSIITTTCLADTVFTGNKSYEIPELPYMVNRTFDREEQVSVDNPFTSFIINFNLEGKDFSDNDTWYVNLVDQVGNVYGSAELDATGDAQIQLQYDKPSFTNSTVTLTQSTKLYPLVVKKDYGVFELENEYQINGSKLIKDSLVANACALYDDGTDTDGDQWTDVQETALGMNPDTYSTIKQLMWISNDNGNKKHNYQIQATPGPSYTIETTTDLNESWNIAKQEFRVNTPKDVKVSYNLDSKRFYRLNIDFEGKTTNIE